MNKQTLIDKLITLFYDFENWMEDRFLEKLIIGGWGWGAGIGISAGGGGWKLYIYI